MQFIVRVSNYHKILPYIIINLKSPHIPMELQSQVKDALKQLPPAERVVAFALKSIYEKIKNLHDKQDKQILQARQQFVSRFKQLEQSTSQIINGKKLSKDDLASLDQFFVEEEKKQLDSILVNTHPVKQYWLVALKNSRLKGYITEIDEKILAHLTKLQQKVTQTTIEISLTFQGSSQVKDGTYNRIIQLENGIPINFKGDEIKTKTTLSEGLIYELSEQIESSSNQNLTLKLQLVTFIVTELIPYGLRYYLGEVDDIDAEYEDEENEQEEQEQESQEDEQQKPRKK